MGYTVWRRRARGQGGWIKVSTGLGPDAAQVSVRALNAEAKAEHTGWVFSTAVDGAVPNV